MSDLQWSDDPPGEPGWYWMREELYKNAEVVKVIYDSGLKALRVSGEEFKVGGSLTYSAVEWAGPIPEPTE